MASRKIQELHPEMQKLTQAFLQACKEDGLDVLIYCTLRPHSEQAQLYRKGRPWAEIQKMIDRLRAEFDRPDLAQLIIDAGPQGGNKVTNAGPGMSLHGYGFAFDAVPLMHGKTVWETDDQWEAELWQEMGKIGAAVGLDWGGNWKGFTDMPHFQMPGESWRELIQQG